MCRFLRDIIGFLPEAKRGNSWMLRASLAGRVTARPSAEATPRRGVGRRREPADARTVNCRARPPRREHAARQADAARASAEVERSRARRSHGKPDRQRAPGPRASVLEGRRRRPVAPGAGFWLVAGRGGVRSLRSPDSAPYTRSRYSSAPLARRASRCGRPHASRPHPSQASAAPGATSSSSRSRWRAHPRTQLSLIAPRI